MFSCICRNRIYSTRLLSRPSLVTRPAPITGFAADLRAEGPSDLAAGSAAAGGRNPRREAANPVRPTVCGRANTGLTCLYEQGTFTLKPPMHIKHELGD